MTSNPPQSAGLAAKQAAAAAAARFAGYSSFYASPTPHAQPQNQTQFFQPAGPPPPRPGMFNGPRSSSPSAAAPVQWICSSPAPSPAVRAQRPRAASNDAPAASSSVVPTLYVPLAVEQRQQCSKLGPSQDGGLYTSCEVQYQSTEPWTPSQKLRPAAWSFLGAETCTPRCCFGHGRQRQVAGCTTQLCEASVRALQGSSGPEYYPELPQGADYKCHYDEQFVDEELDCRTSAGARGRHSGSGHADQDGDGGPMPGAAGHKFASSPSSSSLQPNQTFIPFKEPSSKKNKTNKRKHDGFEIQEADVQRKNQRRQRFHMTQQELKSLVTPEVDTKKLQVLTQDGDLDLAAMVIKGTSQTVEKEYLRLTSPPHPSTVRPEPVLRKALELVKSKWKKGDHDYIYACSQLKSIRQDCTVQHIKNDFTVSVYETHARVALESGDINEFNQCQTQLHELYEKLIPGEAIEFLAYRILYCVYVSLQAKKGDSNAGQLGMYNVLGMVTPRLRTDPAIAHALAVRQAVAMNDYHRFFKLYVGAPNMAGYLMDVMVPAIRLSALRAMCKAYRPTLPVQYIRDELKLEGKAGKAFIRQAGLAFVKGDKTRVDTKTSNIVWALSNESSLI
ncbi:SAC3/GANP/THP3 protein [Phytophthora cactorum]|nr:SAC3/GANP/THP3 protein [Phytophthora cactorum]